MQIKPFFETYEEISREPLLKDDRGMQYSLVHFKGTVRNKVVPHPQGEGMSKEGIYQRYFPRAGVRELVTHHEGYLVLCDKLETWSGGATSYDEVLYWSRPKKLERLEIDGLILQECFEGTNSVFPNADVTMNTVFLVWPK